MSETRLRRKASPRDVRRPATPGLLSGPPAMTRCECADLSFEELLRQFGGPALDLEEVGARTGCGRTCTACLPDLERYLLASAVRSGQNSPREGEGNS